MKATYEDFIADNPNCSGFFDNQDMKELFELLSEEKNIIKLIEMAEMKKPALAGCVEVVENWHNNKSVKQIDLNDGFTRTVVGRLVKTILMPFGYQVTVQRDIPKKYRREYFVSASCYALTGAATMRVVKKIEEI